MPVAQPATTLERLVRRDRAIAATAIAAMAAIAWGYLIHLASAMSTSGMGADAAHHAMNMAAPQTQAWSALQPVLLFAMWAVMMVAMMLPSAAPMILLFAGVVRRRNERASPTAPTAIFVAGYLVVWMAFSAAAVLGQSGLHHASLLSANMSAATPFVGGLVLLTAAGYQWSPVKSVCLGRCRSPLGFLGSEWREGRRGALVMGIRHGLFCLGCCWALMALLFVAGVMNLLWVAVLAAIVLVEKLAPQGPLIGRAAGVLFAVWGVWMLAAVR